MADVKELASLKKGYSVLPDQQLIEMSQQDKDEYIEGAYDLIMQELERRGLGDKAGASDPSDIEGPGHDRSCGAGPCEGTCGPKPEDELLPFLIILGADDMPAIAPLLDGAGIEYCSDPLHLKGKEYPRILMVPRGKVDQAIKLLSPVRFKNGVALW